MQLGEGSAHMVRVPRRASADGESCPSSLHSWLGGPCGCGASAPEKPHRNHAFSEKRGEGGGWGGDKGKGTGSKDSSSYSQLMRLRGSFCASEASHVCSSGTCLTLAAASFRGSSVPIRISVNCGKLQVLASSQFMGKKGNQRYFKNWTPPGMEPPPQAGCQPERRQKRGALNERSPISPGFLAAFLRLRPHLHRLHSTFATFVILCRRPGFRSA
jgi:hypothetical protein